MQARNDKIRARLPRFARNDKIQARLPRFARNDRFLRSPSCHREERSDLAFIATTKGEKRDCRATLAMTDLLARLLVIARNEAISGLRGWQTTKREIAALRSQPPKGALTGFRRDCLAGSQPPKGALTGFRRDCFAGSQPPKGALTEKERSLRTSR